MNDQESIDILELDMLSDAALTHNFGYGPNGIENLRDNAKQVRAELKAAGSRYEDGRIY